VSPQARDGLGPPRRSGATEFGARIDATDRYIFIVYFRNHGARTATSLENAWYGQREAPSRPAIHLV